MIKRQEIEVGLMEILSSARQGLLSIFWETAAVMISPTLMHTTSDLNDEYQEIFDELSDDFSVWQPEIINKNI